MGQITGFNEDELEAIVSLPYRAGLNVSYADDEDGERDDELEMEALTACLTAFVNAHDGEELIRDIAQEVLNSKDKWDKWSQGVFNIEPLCDKAMNALKPKVSAEEAKAYVKMVVEVGTAVAQAYGEFGEQPEVKKGFFGKAMDNIIGGFAGTSADDTNHPMNVSAAEDTAISNITAALKKHI